MKVETVGGAVCRGWSPSTDDDRPKETELKTLSRQEVRKAYREIVEKYGKPQSGDIYCEEQLISKIASDLCAFDETNITFEYGVLEVSPNLSVVSRYAPDHTFVGTVKAKEWYTQEQLKALHEVAFGYQF